MGGMVTVRSALMHKNFFHGMILNGPLIIPGPQVLGMDLRASPFRTFISRAVLKFLSLFIPEVMYLNLSDKTYLNKYIYFFLILSIFYKTL